MQRILQLLQKLISQVRKFLTHEVRSKSRPARRVSSTRKPISIVLPGKLAVGGLPQPGDSERLEKANIKAVISLCAVSEGKLPKDVEQNFCCLRFILPDSRFNIQLQASELASVVALIHQHIQNEEPVYVHCLAGMERSPTACIAYLCRHHNLELWEAVNFLKQAHPNTMPTNAQIQVIREFIKSSQSLGSLQN